MHDLIRMSVCALVLALYTPGAAAAQRTQAATRKVTLVQTSSLPDGKRAMVYHRAGTGTPVIALVSHANAADVGGALMVLDALYAQFGDTATRDIVAAASVNVVERKGARGKLDAAFLHELQRSRAKPVSGFGIVKVMEIQVPKRRGRPVG